MILVCINVCTSTNEWKRLACFMLNQLIFSTETGSMMHLYHTVDASVDQITNNSSRISNPKPKYKGK